MGLPENKEAKFLLFPVFHEISNFLSFASVELMTSTFFSFQFFWLCSDWLGLTLSSLLSGSVRGLGLAEPPLLL